MANGLPTTCASKILGNWKAPYNAHVVERLAGRGGGHRRQDQPRRVRHGLLDRELRLRHDAQPLGPGPRARRLERRQRRRRRRPHGAAGPRVRHRRLDPPAGGPVRRRGPEAHLRPRQPLRPHRVRLEPRPDRPVRPHGGRRGAAPRRPRRPRPARLDQRRRQGRVPDYLAALEQPVKGLRIGVPREFFAAGLDPEVEEIVREALAVYERLGARLVDVDAAALDRVRHRHVLHRGHERGLVEPGPLRRRALRVPVERPRRHDRHVHAQPGRGVRRRGQAPHHARHLRPERGLLRRVLQEGPAGAAAHPAATSTRPSRSCDCLMGPTSPTPAFRIGERAADPLAMYLSDIYTVSSNLAGHRRHQPAVRPDGGRAARWACRFSRTCSPRRRSSAIARMYERECDWSTRVPPAAGGAA